MKNILLVFSYNVTDYAVFDEIITEFDRRDYIVHEISGLTPENLTIDVLPSVLENIKEQSGEWDRLVVLSNLRELIFAWYRCYNALVNDFIYYIDDCNLSFIRKDSSYAFYQCLFDFVGIENEVLQGKIYVNFNYRNFVPLMNFLFANNSFQYFTQLSFFDYLNAPKKQFRAKEYLFNDQIYQLYSGKSNSITETVNLENRTIPFNLTLLNEHLYFIKYFSIWVFRNSSKRSHFEKILFSYLQNYIIDVEDDKRLIILKDLIEYIENESSSFAEKIFILCIAALLKCNSDLTMKYFMKTLVKDEDHLEYHPSVLANTLFYVNALNLKMTDEMYLARRLIIDRLVEKYEKKFDSEPKRTPGKIAIIYDQLITLGHSPTSFLASHIKYMKQLNPELQIKIFVEDTLSYAPGEIITPYRMTYSSPAPSAWFHEEHKALFDLNELEICYSDCTKERKLRTLEIVDEIVRFEPEIIFTTSDISIARAILYPYYPVIYLSNGDFNFATRADVFLYGEIKHEELFAINDKYNLIDPDAVLNYAPGVQLSEPKKVIKREDFQIKEDQFVMVTVGNRLDGEMKNDFIDMVCSFLQQHQNTVWLVVGPRKIPYLQTQYASLIRNRQILLIEYEEDLSALYQICSVYINPFRRGGGFSIALAMNQGLPILITNTPSDGLEFTGTDCAVSENAEAYLAEIKRLMTDQAYYEVQRTRIKDRIQGLTVVGSIRCLFEAFKVANERYFKRLNTPGH